MNTDLEDLLEGRGGEVTRNTLIPRTGFLKMHGGISVDLGADSCRERSGKTEEG